MGSASHDLLDALCDMDVSDVIFNDVDSVDVPHTPKPKPAKVSDDGTTAGAATPVRGRFNIGSGLPMSPQGRSGRSRSAAGPFLRLPSEASPLAQLFTGGIQTGNGPRSAAVNEDLVTSMRRIEGLLEGLPEAQKVRAEADDLRVKLGKIEAMLQDLIKNRKTW